jgi:hypothetical protein
LRGRVFGVLSGLGNALAGLEIELLLLGPTPGGTRAIAMGHGVA